MRFAYDLVLLCKGDYKLVQMILQGLNLFTATIGLKASPAKSNVYGCGMTDQGMKRIADIVGFKIGSLPFRYLGVLISVKKLSIADYENLI